MFDKLDELGQKIDQINSRLSDWAFRLLPWLLGLILAPALILLILSVWAVFITLLVDLAALKPPSQPAAQQTQTQAESP